MNRTMLSMFLIAAALATVAVAARQPSADDERRDAITLMRAINTAEAATAARSADHKYAALAALIDHSAMGRVRPEIAVSGSGFTYKGAQIRLALSTDATEYIVTSISPSGVAAFTNERGVIYTGESLK